MTFVKDGRPDPNTKSEILAGLILLAEDSFGHEFTADEISVARSFYDPVAEYFAAQQQDLAQVVDSTQIDHAEGGSLDLLAALIGVSRLEAAPATTRLQFQHDTPVTRDYTIPSGTGSQTDSAETVRFDTEEFTSLQYIDGFEDQDLDEYVGDTGIFSTQGTTVYEGSYALEASGSVGEIVDIDTNIEVGTRFHNRIYLNTNTAASLLFGVDTLEDYYKVVLDESLSECRVDVVESNTETELGSVSTSIPTAEWLHVRTDWNHDGEFEVLIEDSSGSEVASFEASEPVATFEEGGIGFGSEDTNGSKFFDEATTSRVSVDAIATTSGADTNVGANSLIVISSSVPGVDEVTNPVPASGGRERETDDDFRVRARDEPRSSLRATLPAMVSRLDSLDVTRTVTVIDNDSNSTDTDGRPPHSFEPIVDVDAENYTEVADTILETKAVGDTSVGGYEGSGVTRTVELINGQDKDISFSTPASVKIYVGVSLEKTDTYAGDDQIRDSIVQYIGGTLSSGNNTDGEIGAGDDAIYFQILEAIMDVEGVHDVTNLNIGTSSSPSGTSNITIADNETANADATDSSIDVTSSDA